MAKTDPQTPARPQPKLLSKIAARYNVDAAKLLDTLKATAFKAQGNGPPATDEQLMALMIVADQYGLNPFTREIYAFPDKKNGIVPVVGIDGWSRIINTHPEFDGMDFVESDELADMKDAKPCPVWIECRMHRKDRGHPIVTRERLAECYRPPFEGKGNNGQPYTVAGPWQSHTSRMLRHKAMIQAARIAFGFAGIFDPDEAERIRDATAIDAAFTEVGRKPATAEPQATAPAVAQLTHVPKDEILRRIDQIGVPMNEFCANFNVGSVDELALKDVPAVMDYLNRVAAG